MGYYPSEASDIPCSVIRELAEGFPDCMLHSIALEAELLALLRA